MRYHSIVMVEFTFMMTNSDLSFYLVTFDVILNY